MRFFICLIIGLFPLTFIAQLQTTGGYTATQLVQNVLLGNGVTVSNINYYGSASAIGTFDATNTSLGIDEGVIMTTGTVNSGPEGPYGPNNKPDAGMDNGVGGYAALSNIVGANTYNSAVLEFDFIPFSDTVRFRYIFASEEYPEYVGSQFNDIFAFFISGPGIPGGMQNMAIIPGTSQEVTINNVSHLNNTTYYQSNGDGNTAPYNGNPFYVQYDGFTQPMEAVSKVKCGEKYHLVIAIADVGDAIYDSGIFLEKNSLNSDQPISIEYELTSDPYGDGQTMAQNCSGAVITITRSGNLINQPLTLPYTISGTAIEGLDYTNLPANIYFAPGQTTVTFTIDALYNPSLTSIANLILQFEIEDPCGEVDQYETIELFIKPVAPLSLSLQDQIILCPGGHLELIPIVSGGGGAYEYVWSTGETSPTITVSPSSTTTYTLSVTDECLNETVEVSAIVTVKEYEPLVLETSENIVDQCPYEVHTLWANVSGGSGSFQYQWFDLWGVSISSTDIAMISTPETTSYTVVATDYCGEQISSTIVITVLNPPLRLEISPTQEICPGDSIEISVSAIGGWGKYHYLWLPSGDTTASIWVKPGKDTEYRVIVNDDCKTYEVNAKTWVKVISPTANFRPITDPLFANLPISFENLSIDGHSYYWDFGSGATSTMINPNNTFSASGTYDVMLITTDRNGCIDTIIKPIKILEEFYLYIPNSFTPDGDHFNNFFMVFSIGIEEFELKIFNRWGEILFEAHNSNFVWDGTYGGKIVPDGTYIWKMTYKSVNDTEKQMMTGHVNILR